MRGMSGDEHNGPAFHTHRQALQRKDSHEMTFLSRPRFNPGLPGSPLFRWVLLYFSRDLIRSSIGRMNSSKEVNLYREFQSLVNPSLVATLPSTSAQRVYRHSNFLPICGVLEMEGG